MTDIFESAFATPMTRQRLIKTIAAAGMATWASGGLVDLAQAAPAHGRRRGRFGAFVSIPPSAEDVLQVPDGYVAEILLKWGDEFAPGMKFGYNCDYSAFFPLRGRSDDDGHRGFHDDDNGRGGFDGLVWVNHEYVIPLF